MCHAQRNAVVWKHQKNYLSGNDFCAANKGFFCLSPVIPSILNHTLASSDYWECLEAHFLIENAIKAIYCRSFILALQAVFGPLDVNNNYANKASPDQPSVHSWKIISWSLQLDLKFHCNIKGKSNSFYLSPLEVQMYSMCLSFCLSESIRSSHWYLTVLVLNFAFATHWKFCPWILNFFFFWFKLCFFYLYNNRHNLMRTAKPSPFYAF